MSFVSKFRNLAAPLGNVFKTTTSVQKTALHSSAALQCTEDGDTEERKKLEKKFKEDIARDFDWHQPGLTLVPPIPKVWVDKICDKEASTTSDQCHTSSTALTLTCVPVTSTIKKMPD